MAAPYYFTSVYCQNKKKIDNANQNCLVWIELVCRPGTEKETKYSINTVQKYWIGVDFRYSKPPQSHSIFFFLTNPMCSTTHSFIFRVLILRKRISYRGAPNVRNGVYAVELTSTHYPHFSFARSTHNHGAHTEHLVDARNRPAKAAYEKERFQCGHAHIEPIWQLPKENIFKLLNSFCSATSAKRAILYFCSSFAVTN